MFINQLQFFARRSRGAAPPQLPAFAVMAGSADRGRIPLRPRHGCAKTQDLIFIYLSKNPVNLSIFVEFFGNSDRAESAASVAGGIRVALSIRFPPPRSIGIPPASSERFSPIPPKTR